MKAEKYLTLKPHVCGVEQFGDRIEVSAGTMFACGLKSIVEPYKDWARVAKPPWRRLSNEEMSRLLVNEEDTLAADIHLIRAPQQLIRRLQHPLGDITRYATKEDFKHALNTEEYRDCIEELGQWAATFGEVTKQAVVRINSPGLCTVTRVNGDGTYIGMHVDNWYGQNMVNRETSPNRICLNIGFEPRYFLFINVPMKIMFSMLQEKQIDGIHAEMVGTPLGLAFMEIFPDYPVLRLRVEPGEAYIAPTENIVHDASTMGMKSWDLLASILGSFSA